ncbi:MAG: TerB family tellurite resistance protein [Deltaproteobacteria bacterium]|nr:TerB family tellurite resistance protein [Deltaproteobacteria bacterium]
MDIDFKTKISALKSTQREWFATAMVAMVLADGDIDRSEVDFIMKMSTLVKDDATVERLKKFIQFKTMPPLGPPVDIDRKLGMTMIVDLIRIAVSDKDFDTAEKELIQNIGKGLGFKQDELDKLIMYGFELMTKG